MKKLLILFAGFTLLFAGCSKDTDPIDPADSVRPSDFLTSAKYNKLIVEILYVSGYQPTTQTVNNLVTFLQQRLNKPAGITVVQKAISSQSRSTYTIDNIRAIERANRTQTTSGNTLTAFVFFTDADYAGNSGNSKVLGVAYAPTSLALFEKTIQDYSGGVTQPAVTTLESTVMHHELGHLLGLVNAGTPMQTAHQDAPHGKHCTNQNCLMYWATETSDVIANLTGGNVPELDANCLNDLRANGGL